MGGLNCMIFLVYLQLKINKVLKTSQINMFRNLFYASGCLIIGDFKWVCKHTELEVSWPTGYVWKGG